MLREMCCRVCGIQFRQRKPGMLTCSERCRKPPRPVARPGYAPGLNKGTVGDIAVLAVAVDLLRQGYSVFRALSGTTACDLVAIRGAEVRRVEVRSATRSPVTGYLNYARKGDTEATEFALYVHEEGVIAYVPVPGPGVPPGTPVDTSTPVNRLDTCPAFTGLWDA